MLNNTTLAILCRQNGGVSVCARQAGLCVPAGVHASACLLLWTPPYSLAYEQSFCAVVCTCMSKLLPNLGKQTDCLCVRAGVWTTVSACVRVAVDAAFLTFCLRASVGEKQKTTFVAQQKRAIRMSMFCTTAIAPWSKHATPFPLAKQHANSSCCNSAAPEKIAIPSGTDSTNNSSRRWSPREAMVAGSRACGLHPMAVHNSLLRR